MGLVLVGVISALNLAILLVVLRRWRELEATGGGAHSHGFPASGAISPIRVGDRLPSFSARALDGTAVTERTLLGQEALVGFFSLTCKACVDAVPFFTGHAERLRANGGTTLAIVHGDAAADSELAAMLTDVMDIVIAEDSEAELSKRYGAKRYPSHAWYGPDGVVTGAGAGVVALRTDLVAS
ncbi:alkyl hydroperoxide reductase/ Thiol specific antioxidant/ Mal allergen [Streptomyces bingchenggensis BCW-1]|uniref:Alkyl hydroperoxide reductase/ Thiol specific antioxidant/ Mal allergen n=1 Tax=Streptomyces bingchenggensis (strain BCW-1) TaxID=749414 RepID=D7C809_STRBB|nr:alkyl hydroperoxide reductase/ Thiol specific antioxidant/ Mal allergen [Streptomyces bingchenggensis BCW-1]